MNRQKKVHTRFSFGGLTAVAGKLNFSRHPIMIIKTRKTFLICILALIVIFQEICFGHSWMAPSEAAKKENPIPMSTESKENGQALFDELCAYCHGFTATGASKEKTGLNQDTPNLPNRLKTHTDGDFHWKIMKGRGEMPSFEDELSEKETWDIINYIKSIIKK